MERPYTVLLTGATGFVGNALFPALTDRGCAIRCLTRDPDAARSRWPDREWWGIDLDRAAGLDAALAGCDAAFYLVHSMGSGEPGFREKERQAARRFAETAARAGVGRILYLGGVEPKGEPSEHLASRREVGEILRGGCTAALELRAGVIVGHGSISWRIIRDLAARLPVMVLPAWLRSAMEPVAIDDVVAALARGLDVSLPASAVYDLPGPERMTGEEILCRTAEALGLPAPLLVRVPVLSLGLSAQWVRWVTRADWRVARELVLGLRGDLLAENAAYWNMIGHAARLGFAEAARRALRKEPLGATEGPGGWIERMIAASRGMTASGKPEPDG